MVTVGHIQVFFAHESLARDLRHRREDALIFDAHTHEVSHHVGTLRSEIHEPNSAPRARPTGDFESEEKSARATEGPRAMGNRPEAGGSAIALRGFRSLGRG